jgi:hypothetical protein
MLASSACRGCSRVVIAAGGQPGDGRQGKVESRYRRPGGELTDGLAINELGKRVTCGGTVRCLDATPGVQRVMRSTNENARKRSLMGIAAARRRVRDGQAASGAGAARG